MRKLLICAALAVGGVMSAAPAKATEGQWCLKAQIGRGVVSEICHFRTFDACNQERSIRGTTAFCSPSQYYLPYWQGRGFDQQPPPKLAHKKRHRRVSAH